MVIGGLMTVQDLINLLNDLPDKTLPIFLYNSTITELTDDMIDLNIADRIDINIPSDF
jgi:hypothetical protein